MDPKYTSRIWNMKASDCDAWNGSFGMDQMEKSKIWKWNIMEKWIGMNENALIKDM